MKISKTKNIDKISKFKNNIQIMNMNGHMKNSPITRTTTVCQTRVGAATTNIEFMKQDSSSKDKSLKDTNEFNYPLTSCKDKSLIEESDKTVLSGVGPFMDLSLWEEDESESEGSSFDIEEYFAELPPDGNKNKEPLENKDQTKSKNDKHGKLEQKMTWQVKSKREEGSASDIGHKTREWKKSGDPNTDWLTPGVELDRQRREHFDNPNKIKLPGSKKGAMNHIPQAPINPHVPTPPSKQSMVIPAIATNVNLNPPISPGIVVPQALNPIAPQGAQSVPPPLGLPPAQQPQQNQAPNQQPPQNQGSPPEPGSVRQKFDTIEVDVRISALTNFFVRTTFMTFSFLVYKIMRNPSKSKFLLGFFFALFQYALKFMAMKTKAILQLRHVNSHTLVAQRHEQNRLIQPIVSEFHFMKYEVDYKGPLSSVYNWLPQAVRFYIEDWAQYFDEATTAPKVEHYSSELLQSVLKPKILSGHGSEATTLHQIEREITNRSDTMLSEIDIESQNTIMSTTNVAKHIVKNAYRKTAELGFHNASTNRSTSKDIECLIYQPSGGYRDQGNQNPISNSLSVRAFLKDCRGAVLLGGALASMSWGRSTLFRILEILWDQLPVRLKDRLLRCLSSPQACDLRYKVQCVLRFTSQESTTWNAIYQQLSDSATRRTVSPLSF